MRNSQKNIKSVFVNDQYDNYFQQDQFHIWIHVFCENILLYLGIILLIKDFTFDRLANSELILHKLEIGLHYKLSGLSAMAMLLLSHIW